MFHHAMVEYLHGRQVAGCQVGGARQLGKHWSVVRHEWLQLGDGVNVAVVRKIELVRELSDGLQHLEWPKVLACELGVRQRSFGRRVAA